MGRDEGLRGCRQGCPVGMGIIKKIVRWLLDIELPPPTSLKDYSSSDLEIVKNPFPCVVF